MRNQFFLEVSLIINGVGFVGYVSMVDISDEMPSLTIGILVDNDFSKKFIEMHESVITGQNIDRLESLGYIVLSPE